MASSSAKMMRAVICDSPGPVSVLNLREVPVPTPQPGQVLVKVLAFGINRAEMFTRQGHSPGIIFPRIIGIELIGTVAGYPPGDGPEPGDIPIGSRVATCMGGLGRQIPGSYAEYSCPWKKNIRAVPDTTLPLATLAAMPEMFQTAYGSLVDSLDLQRGESILVRGATSSVGLTALQLARYLGAGRVAATTRSGARAQMLRDLGATDVFVDDGNLADQVPAQFDKVLELVGATTLKDSVKCLRPKGTVCMTGIQGGKWVLDDFAPMTDLPQRRRLTGYSGDPSDFLALPWEQLIKAVEARTIQIPLREFRLDQLQEVHKVLEDGGGGVKMVVVI
ncbi:alcohol dehydrogenase superfamily, zinc-type [Purpureocillium lavendulum]|uniref:Alcohol dehydrogenase superfamily, zinc-type n=1 Tax=Purpureocillium lavendulum TaxID=1247861 RepID=A0AB34G0G2_9HYPO|nr:alcohol dehydrogenase superfamily, zinc-type [Purpureocillium lavendulum]